MRDQALSPPISPEGGGYKACKVVQKVSHQLEKGISMLKWFVISRKMAALDPSSSSSSSGFSRQGSPLATAVFSFFFKYWETSNRRLIPRHARQK